MLIALEKKKKISKPKEVENQLRVHGLLINHLVAEHFGNHLCVDIFHKTILQ